MFILSRFVKSEGLKMVLSGEGADEIFGGYLYFHAAPSAAEFHKETVSRVRYAALSIKLSIHLQSIFDSTVWGI